MNNSTVSLSSLSLSVRLGERLGSNTSDFLSLLSSHFCVNATFTGFLSSAISQCKWTCTVSLQFPIVYSVKRDPSAADIIGLSKPLSLMCKWTYYCVFWVRLSLSVNETCMVSLKFPISQCMMNPYRVVGWRSRLSLSVRWTCFVRRVDCAWWASLSLQCKCLRLEQVFEFAISTSATMNL